MKSQHTTQSVALEVAETEEHGPRERPRVGAWSEQGFAGSMHNSVPVYTPSFQLLACTGETSGDLVQISTRNSPKCIPLSIRKWVAHSY